ncbi:MAG: hypothetical protein V3U02_00265 [Calditrichia bacterium]
MLTQTDTAYEPICSFTISARGKKPNVPIFSFLRRNFGFVTLAEIESIYAFVEQSTLYGGRPFILPELSERDIRQLNNAGIGLRLPMSNHYATREEYDANCYLLQKYHRKENSVIVTNDDLVKWIRQDFPLYRLDASVIKNIHTYKQIDQALEVYDNVVLPMCTNENISFLEKIEAKDRIILFANAGCALTCPSKICYASISKKNKFDNKLWKGNEISCSRTLKHREQLGMVDFDLIPLMELGFFQFKLLRPKPCGMTGF